MKLPNSVGVRVRLAHMLILIHSEDASIIAFCDAGQILVAAIFSEALVTTSV